MNDDQSNQYQIIEQKLRIQEEQFEGVFESSLVGMAIIGLEGKWIRINNSLLRMLGYEMDRLYQLTFQDITHPDDLQKDLQLLDSLIMGEIESYQMEKRYFSSKGEIVWGLLSVSVVRDSNTKPLHFVSQILDITETKRINHLRLKEMDKKINHIAHELHENFAQTLASIKLLLASSRAGRTYAAADLNSVDKKMTTLISDIQRLTEQIVPTTFMDENLHSLLNGLVVRYSVSHGLKIELAVDDDTNSLPFGVTYNIYRIVEDLVQLALLRDARKVSVELSYSGSLLLNFTDNGVVENDLHVPESELLINNIKTRVEMVEGVLNSSADLYGRNDISIHIPLSRS